MSKRTISIALLVITLSSSPLFAAPRRDDAVRPDRPSFIGRLIHRIFQILDTQDLTLPKP